MNNKLLRNLCGIMRAEIAAISFYLKVIDFFFLSSPHFSQHTVLYPTLPSLQDNRAFKRLCLIMHPTLIFLRSQELTALNRNEETSFCIVLDKFLFHKKKKKYIFSAFSPSLSSFLIVFKAHFVVLWVQYPSYSLLLNFVSHLLLLRRLCTIYLNVGASSFQRLCYWKFRGGNWAMFWRCDVTICESLLNSNCDISGHGSVGKVIDFSFFYSLRSN